MLDMLTIKNGFDDAVLVKGFARVVELYSVVLDYEQDVGSDLVHALPVAYIGIELAEGEEDVGQDALVLGLSGEVEHTALHILQDLGAQILILTQLLPGGILAWV